MDPIDTDLSGLPEILNLKLTQDQVMTNMAALQFCLTILGEEDEDTRQKLRAHHGDIVSQVTEQVQVTARDDAGLL